MSEISPRPWTTDGNYIWDCNDEPVWHDTRKQVKHIVKCVNKHDSLVAEIEAYKLL